ncbi:MAG: hypothetical protein Q8M83_00915 [bacterium]|nr:hypothetical protein [bacterium]
MRKIIFAAVGVMFLGYLAFEGRGLLLSPPLQLFSPPTDFVTTDPNIVLSGQTTPGTRLQINGTELLPNEQGYFQEKLVLQTGLNTLEIKATKRYARTRVVERKILVKEESALSKNKEGKDKGI